jgi:hypothetical protein
LPILLIYCADLINIPRKKIMKKFITLFLAAAALTITTVSCSKDSDSSNSSSETAIKGKWYYDTTLTTYNGTTNPQEMPYDYSQCTGKKSYLDFQSGGVLDEGAIFSDCTLHNFTDSWTLNGNALNTVLDTGEAKNYEVVSVTSNKLVLKNYVSTDKKSYTVYNFTRQ